MCNCRTTGARTIVCDECAARMVEALNDLGQPQAEPPTELNAVEYQGLTSLVNLWMDSLGDQQEGGQA